MRGEKVEQVREDEISGREVGKILAVTEKGGKLGK